MELEKIGYVKPRRSEEIENSPWGIGCEDIVNPAYPFRIPKEKSFKAPISAVEIAEYVATLGVKWARVWAEWPLIMTGNGRYHWDRMDEAIEELVKRKVQPFICLCSHSGAHFNYPPTSSAEKMKVWLDFVRAFVDRYHDRVRYWEIWNEPNIAYFWKPEPDPEAYARLVKETSKTIKQIDPDATILAGVLAMVDTAYAEKLFARGIASYIDKLVYHPYGEIPEASIEPVKWLKKLVDMQKKIGLWQGECGYPSREHTAGWYGTGPWGENIQAKWLLRRLLTDIFSGAEVSSIYAIIENVAEIEDPNASDYGKEGINAKGLLRFGSWQPKPSYFAYQNLTSLIDSSFTPTTLHATFKIVDQGIFYGARPEKIMAIDFLKSREVSLAYWLPWRPQEIIKPAKVDISLDSVKIEEPVLIDLLDGAIYSVDQAFESKNRINFSSLPLADYPMILTSRKSVNMKTERPYP
jgi:hypothetical protein